MMSRNTAMAETSVPPAPEERALVYLRAIRAILEDHTRRFDDDVITRLARLERETAATRRDIAELLRRELDGFDKRLAQIEHHLGLFDDPAAADEP
jgi:hypothetical protein